MTTQPASDGDPPRSRHTLAGAAVGVLTAAVAIGVSQLAAGLTVPQSSPVLAVGQTAIDLTPPPVKNFAISTFGSDDKLALLAGILVILALYAAWVGTRAVRRLSSGLWGLSLFALIGLFAALNRPGSSPVYVVPTLAGAAAGAFALTRLASAAAGLAVPAARPRNPGRSPAAPASPQALTPPDLPASPEVPTLPDGPAAPHATAPPDGPAAPHATAPPDGPAPPGSFFTFLPNPGDKGPPRGPARRRFLVAGGA